MLRVVRVLLFVGCCVSCDVCCSLVVGRFKLFGVCPHMCFDCMWFDPCCGSFLVVCCLMCVVCCVLCVVLLYLICCVTVMFVC